MALLDGEGLGGKTVGVALELINGVGATEGAALGTIAFVGEGVGKVAEAGETPRLAAATRTSEAMPSWTFKNFTPCGCAVSEIAAE